MFLWSDFVHPIDLQPQEQRIHEYQLLHAARTGSKEDLIQYQHLLETLHTVVIDNVYNERGYNVLHISSMVGQLQMVVYLVEECKMNFDIKTNNKFKSTALQVASRYGHLPIVEYFIEQCHADINESNSNGSTALHFASSNGYIDVVRYLTQNCGPTIDIERKNKHGLTPLHCAVQSSRLSIVQFLVMECQVNVEAKTNHGWTPLHIAILFRSKMSIVQYLIDMCHVDITATNDQDQTILDILFYLYRKKRRNATDYCNDVVVYLLQNHDY